MKYRLQTTLWQRLFNVGTGSSPGLNGWKTDWGGLTTLRQLSRSPDLPTEQQASPGLCWIWLRTRETRTIETLRWKPWCTSIVSTLLRQETGLKTPPDLDQRLEKNPDLP